MRTTVSIQQPEFFPWLGFFNKVVNADKVVLLDIVQFKKRYFENRIKIRNYKSWQWLRVPVLTKGKYTQRICEVEIDNSVNWRDECVRAIELNYKKAPYYKKYAKQIFALYDKRWLKLSDFSIEALKTLTKLLGVDKEFICASDLDLEGKSTTLLLNICKKVGAKRYLSGHFGKDYLDEKLFNKNGVTVVYQEFVHPAYRQSHGEFIANMSTIDLLFNEGPRSLAVIKSGFSL